MASGARRFCWRERSERINWRMLKALDLPDVVRRGDPALLEPYALHLTFARLPTAAHATGDRDAWFVVRVFQLSMEYLLFMRSRDGDVLDSLFQQLQQCEQERDEMRGRADKWKGRAQSGERQVEKLHQVLQNIAKLLNVHGASPSAVATIETLLTELVVERRERQAKKRQLSTSKLDNNMANPPSANDAQVCGRCGKLFSSALYLEKHVERRHSGKPETRRPTARSQSPVPPTPISSNNSNNDEPSPMQALALQKMVEQLDKMLHSHEENFRILSAQEANRVQHLYEQFHVKAQLVEELKASRLQGEQDLRAQREALSDILREKSDMSDKLGELKDEIQRLTLQHKQLIESQTSAAVSVPNLQPVTTIRSESDASRVPVTQATPDHGREEARRLQLTLEEVSQALEETRVKLSRLQAEHVGVIREKQLLCDRLDQARDKIDRLEEAAIAASETSSTPTLTPAPVAVATRDATTQTTLFHLVEAAAQTDATLSISLQQAQPPEQSKLHAEETGTQTDREASNNDPRLHVDTAAQTSVMDTVGPENAIPQPTTQIVDQSVSTNTHDEVDAVVPADAMDNADIPEYIQELGCRELVNAVAARSERAAIASVTAAMRNPVSLCDSGQFRSIPRRNFLRSRFLHSETAVNSRIASCSERLDAFAGRFGVSSQSGQVLSDEHLALVRQALHAHLEVLPTDVLDRMVECETSVNKLIETEWVPREKTRQQALDRLKLASRTKSELNQALVKQAMVVFAARSTPEAEEARQVPPISTAEERKADADSIPTMHSVEVVGNGGRSMAQYLDDARIHGRDHCNDALDREEHMVLVGNSSLSQEQTDQLRKEAQVYEDRNSAQRDDENYAAAIGQHRESETCDKQLQSITPDRVPIPILAHATPSSQLQLSGMKPEDALSTSRNVEVILSSPKLMSTTQDSQMDYSAATTELNCNVADQAATEMDADSGGEDQVTILGHADSTPPLNLPTTDDELKHVGKTEQGSDDAEDTATDELRWMPRETNTVSVRPVAASITSERSVSLVASSELSFATSIPSLESEEQRGEEVEASRADSTPGVEEPSPDHSDDESREPSILAVEEWETIDSHDADDLPAHFQHATGMLFHIGWMNHWVLVSLTCVNVYVTLRSHG